MKYFLVILLDWSSTLSAIDHIINSSQSHLLQVKDDGLTDRVDRLEIPLQTSTNEVDLLNTRLEESENKLKEATDNNKNSRIFNDDGRQQLTNASGMPTGYRDLIDLGHVGNGFYQWYKATK